MASDRNTLLKSYLYYTQALIESMQASVRGQEHDVWRYSSYREYISKYNQVLTEAMKIINRNIPIDYYELHKIPKNVDTLAMEQKSLFDSVHTNLLILRAYLENELDLKKGEVTNLKDFFQANLRRAVIRTPTCETDIQDVTEQLLIGRGLAKGIDYDRETGRVKVSIKEVIPDFVLYRLDMALEVKFSKDKPRSKAIVDEINADISAFAKKYARQLFVVYDMGSIRDENEFKNDLDNSENVSVIVVKH